MKIIKSTKNSVFSLCRLLTVALAIFVFSTAASAYDEDTHFQMTYVLCRSVGFTPQEALVIAAADQGMDDSTHTIANVLVIIPRPKQQWLWHAFDRGGKMRAAGIIARRDELFRQALQETDQYKKLVRFGVFFHYQQDSWAHRHHGRPDHLSPDNYTPFKTPIGHGFFGTVPDGPPLDPVAAFMCLQDGIVFAGRFLHDGLGREPNPFLAGYTPRGGSVDVSWTDKRKGKYFRQIDLSGAAADPARSYLLELIRAQIGAHKKCLSIYPHYFLRRTAVVPARLEKVKAALEEVGRKYKAYLPGPDMIVPTTADKKALGFSRLRTSALLKFPLPDAAPFVEPNIAAIRRTTAILCAAVF
ncbi:MAG TPA: DUF6765 family protein [Pyrinomonadaceae bacterium]|jgi:hypothetical protein|nr:DUF6765 family protein [Pyrinomonadaceae bacterium]